jgi:hypothetical protein
MLTCGACADEIVLQEGIRQPGHACKSPLHAPLQYLHSAMMCDAVWHLLVAIVMCMAIDTSICERGFSLMNLLKTTKRSTMGNELLRILMTVCSLGKDAGWDDPTKIPIEDIIELWREQSSKGEYANSLYWGAARACWTRWPPPRTLERL